MQGLQIIEIKGQRVLTTKQIAEAYGTDVGTVQYNFRYNKSKYVLGKHYIEISGEELKEMKRTSEIHSSLKQVKHLYLWTEKGALLHAKSLNTDKAWEVYEYLLDFYFRAKEIKQQQVSTSELKPRGRQVVDIPQNAKAQKLLEELQKDITGLEVMMKMYNRYQSEDDYKRIAYTIREVASQAADKAFSMCLLKPNIIERV